MVIELPGEIEDRLDALAKATGRSKAFVAQEAIMTYLEDIEDLEIAEQRLAELKSGQATTISLEEMIEKYGLAD